MTTTVPTETFVTQKITYTYEANGKFYLIENVPAEVCLETGERLYSPDTVEKLQKIFWGNPTPARTIETPVYDFAA